MTTRRDFLHGSGALGVTALVCRQAGDALAQTYPAKPVKILVPTAAGGLADTLARVLATHLTNVMGQQFYVENRGGAGNVIGIESVVRSPADGYTLLFGAGTVTTNHLVYKKLPYDVERDLPPVTQPVLVPTALTAYPNMCTGPL